MLFVLDIPMTPAQLISQGMSRAATALKRPGLAEVILEDSLQALGVLYRLRLSIHPDAVRHAAVICLAGSCAVYAQARELWNPEPERGMIMALLDGDVQEFNACVADARALI
jgi:hypothetical protein